MDSPMYCTVCGTPVWWSKVASAWFHETFPRYLATRALKVSERRSRVIDLSLPPVFPEGNAVPAQERHLSTPL